MKLCAGRSAQELNLSSLGTDAAISHNTARAWLSVLEASYLVVRLPACHANIRKQVVKATKLHFLDSGILCYLFNIREPDQLRHHPLRGAIFESWVVSELYKFHLHRGERPDLHHYRESRGLEMDVPVIRGDRLFVIEIKSAATVAPNSSGTSKYSPNACAVLVFRKPSKTSWSSVASHHSHDRWHVSSGGAMLIVSCHDSEHLQPLQPLQPLQLF